MGLLGIMRLHAWLPFLAALMVAVSLGCRPGKATRERQLKLESDRARYTLENRIKEKRDPRGRVKTARAKLNDRVPVEGPFLISVNLGCTDDNEPMLFFACLRPGGTRIRQHRCGCIAASIRQTERYRTRALVRSS